MRASRALSGQALCTSCDVISLECHQIFLISIQDVKDVKLIWNYPNGKQIY